MTPDELRAIMTFLRERVHLEDSGTAGEVALRFDAPRGDEMGRAGLDADGCRQILEAPWWEEMVADILGTPEMCDPGDSPEEILRYAKDVVDEYIRKRAKL